MNVDELVDFANEAADEVGKYQLQIFLPPKKILAHGYEIPNLSWESIPYGEHEIEEVPNDKRGIYAFAICHHSAVLPPHGYVLYVGIAGRRSSRSLRSRYRDYLSVSKVKKRDRIARMIGHWHEVLRFFFAPIDDAVSSEQLEKMEQQLNAALLPPFSEGDLDADTKRKKRAFK
jgi:hypothetical protein